MKTDVELAKLLERCNSAPEYSGSIPLQEQMELKNFCKEIVKYGGVTHEMTGGKVFTDSTLLRPAKNVLKSMKRKKDAAEE